MVHHIDSILNIFPIICHCFDDIVPTYYFQNLGTTCKKTSYDTSPKGKPPKIMFNILKKEIFIYL